MRWKIVCGQRVFGGREEDLRVVVYSFRAVESDVENVI